LNRPDLELIVGKALLCIRHQSVFCLKDCGRESMKEKRLRKREHEREKVDEREHEREKIKEERA